MWLSFDSSMKHIFNETTSLINRNGFTGHPPPQCTEIPYLRKIQHLVFLMDKKNNSPLTELYNISRSAKEISDVYEKSG